MRDIKDQKAETLGEAKGAERKSVNDTDASPGISKDKDDNVHEELRDTEQEP